MNEKYNIFDLSETHKASFVKFISFFRNKKDRLTKEIKYEIEDFQDSNEDVKDMLTDLKIKINKKTEDEINYYLNMTAVYVQLLYHEVEKKQINIKVETSQVENMKNIKEMSEFIEALDNKGISAEYAKSNIINKLGSISNTKNLISDYEELKNEYDMLKQNFNILKGQNDLLVSENQNLQKTSTDYSKEIDNLMTKISTLSLDFKSSTPNDSKTLENIQNLQKDLGATKINLDEQILKYQKLLKEYDVKINESIQFQQLKKLLQDKNSLIIDLKNKVAKFEEGNK